jgi:hypothetical protein
LEILIDTRLQLFYGWWQFAVCLFAFAALMAIWKHIGKKQNDYGQVWLALSVLCWSFSGLVEVYFASQLDELQVAYLADYQNVLENLSHSIAAVEKLEITAQQLETLQEKQTAALDGFRSILSLFNSLFILLALPWFRYIPKQIEHLIKSKFWPLIVGLPFLFSLLPTLTKLWANQAHNAVSELDVYYAVLTLLFLGAVLWESFAKRRLMLLAWLSVVCILITFIAQLYKIAGSAVDMNLFSAIFKTSLIMIFFALSLSWVKELVENIIPSEQQLFISFERQKKENGRFEQFLIFKGFPGNNERKIALSTTHFDLMLKFAQRKKESPDGWLEIKPKSEQRATKTYDIKDHNEVKRLLIALLNGLFGKGHWTQRIHEQPLKAVLFENSEKRDRKIRLKIPKENIVLVVR